MPKIQSVDVRFPCTDPTPGMAANTGGGVPTGGGALLQCTDERTQGLAGWPVGTTHSPALATPTLWQYPSKLKVHPFFGFVFNFFAC